ncbi:pyrimidine/purine nucleoside phosphorylase [Vibrio amylolyticus]|uniref:pyrimidine/purine nucleoside phosphorylase n=1 Tax=Vibrio TaxID=662 RepID=UPI000C8357CA|nr:pyrimidine/purine nucleoside phosphorylase [Vibrio sp. 10N.261.55.A7]PMK00867.1 hypothetical protein BCU12_19590 [Vibrio sp. 10N.261.55.A7]
MIKINEYFDSNVKSLGFTQKDDQISVGVMEVGDYTFGTAAPEKMTVIKGELVIKRAGEAEWSTYRNGEAFDVVGDSSFDVKVSVTTAYLCEYL